MLILENNFDQDLNIWGQNQDVYLPTEVKVSCNNLYSSSVCTIFDQGSILALLTLSRSRVLSDSDFSMV